MIDEASIGTKNEAPIDEKQVPTRSQKVVEEGNREASKERNEDTGTSKRHLQGMLRKIILNIKV